MDIRDNKESGQPSLLLRKLMQYGASDYYPFHMPGHKRQEKVGITSFPNPFSVDITEIEGFDNLHHAEGILKDAMERAASVYRTDKTYFMVNGSTGGILSAVCGLAGIGGKVIMARNSHKSAYHALLLNRLEPLYVFPDYIEEFGIQGGISPEKVEEILEQESRENGGGDSGIKAVFITSPTYEGVVSDIGKIAEVAHRFKVPLIVDEAHGAHFPFSDRFPASAIDCGADIVIQSLHKTLPSLTQTALLHIKSKIVRAEQVERYLSIFQSSSPSYVFLSSIENCICYMDGEGREQMRRYEAVLSGWRQSVGSLKNLKLLSEQICGSYHVYAWDPSKIVVTAENGIPGTELAKILREQFHLEPEMACSSYVILMTTLMDTEEGLKRLSDALLQIDRMLEGNGQESKHNLKNERALTWIETQETGIGLADAWQYPVELLNLREAEGHISSGFITVYPPGVPMIVPGERVTAKAAELIEKNARLGLAVEGLSDDKKISVCRI